MTRKVIRTILPLAPLQYDHRYVNQLARALDSFIDEQRSPLVNLQGVPSDGAANSLKLGDIYEADGFLKIVRSGEIFSGTTVGTSAVGTVTVSTP